MALVEDVLHGLAAPEDDLDLFDPLLLLPGGPCLLRIAPALARRGGWNGSANGHAAHPCTPHARRNTGTSRRCPMALGQILPLSPIRARTSCTGPVRRWAASADPFGSASWPLRAPCLD